VQSSATQPPATPTSRLRRVSTRSDRLVTLSVRPGAVDSGRPSTRAITRRRRYLDGVGTLVRPVSPTPASCIYYAGGGDKINGVIITKNNGRDDSLRRNKTRVYAVELPPAAATASAAAAGREIDKIATAQKAIRQIMLSTRHHNRPPRQPMNHLRLRIRQAEKTDSDIVGNINARKIPVDTIRC